MDDKGPYTKVIRFIMFQEVCFDKLPLTSHHVLVNSNLILVKNKKSNVGLNTWFLVLCRNGG